MAGLLSIVIILASILLIIVVFIQNPKGGGLSSDFGAATQIGGVEKTNNFIDKATWSFASLIMICSIVLTIKSTPKKQKVKEDPKQEQTQNQGQLPAEQ